MEELPDAPESPRLTRFKSTRGGSFVPHISRRESREESERARGNSMDKGRFDRGKQLQKRDSMEKGKGEGAEEEEEEEPVVLPARWGCTS
jgi:hypothetical protein